MALRTITARRGVAALLACALAAQGCGVHVQLPSAPDRSAPVQHRYSFYQQHRAAAMQTTTRYTVNQFGMVTGASTSLDSLVLANGTAVQYPEDLHPLVDPDSPTAQSADRARRARRISTGLVAGGVAGMLLGVALLIPALTSSVDYGSSADIERDGSNALLWSSLGVLTASTVVYFVGLFGPGATASQERVNAFTALDASLRRRLGLCGVGDTITDCATQGPVVPTLQPLQPTLPIQPSQPAPWGAPPPPAPPTSATPVTPVTL